MKLRTIALLPAVVAGLTAAGLGGAALASAAPASHVKHSPVRPFPGRSDRRSRPVQHWVTVRRGETLASIATAHHLTWQEMYATPPNYRVIHDPRHLTAGERLRLPANPRLRAAEFLSVWGYEAGRARAAKANAAARGGAAAQASAASQPITAGMSAFEQCVAWRESSDTPTDPAGLFGILPSTWTQLGYPGTAGQASVALQKVAFNRLYAEYGTQPWAPSDGC